MGLMSKLGLRGRISLLALSILLVGFGLFSWLGVQSINDSVEKILEQRLTIARIVARYLDERLTYILAQLENAADFGGFPTGEQFDSAAASLQDILARSQIEVREIFLIGRDGEILRRAGEASPVEGGNMLTYGEIRDTLSTGVSRISGLVSSPLTHDPTVLVTAPIQNGEGQILGALTASIDIDRSISGYTETIVVGKTGYIEIVDENGIVLARTKPGFPPELFERSDHPSRFAQLIRQGEATRGTCHRCHATQGEVKRQKDVLAFAPLSTASWGVVIRQAEEEALSPTRQLERRFLLLGGILLALTLFLLWMTIQSIVKPIGMLTLAAKKLAVGDFSAAIPLKRRDEVGQLSAAFEAMRQEIAKSRDELLRLYQEAKQKEELRGQLLSSVISAQEEERKRIARELHDEYGQTLTGLIMSIESLENMATPAQAQFKKKLAHTKALLVRTLEDMRKLTLALRPSSLDDLGLVATLRAYLASYLEDAGLQVTFHHEGVEGRLAPSVEIALFRIIQEAVHNVVKHAQARSVRIELKAKGDTVVAVVEDDGKGFDVDGVLKSKVGTDSLGILGIQERTALLGGTFTIKSQVGRGTRLEVEIPLRRTPLGGEIEPEGTPSRRD